MLSKRQESDFGMSFETRYIFLHQADGPFDVVAEYRQDNKPDATVPRPPVANAVPGGGNVHRPGRMQARPPRPEVLVAGLNSAGTEDPVGRSR